MGRVQKILYYSFGLGMTSPLLALVFGGHIISLTTVTIALVFFDLLLCRHCIRFSYYKKSLYSKYFLIWMIISLVSSVFGFVYFIGFQKEFALSSISFIPKILFYIILFFFFARDVYGEDKMEVVFKGIKFGILLNLVWAIVDASMYYTIGESLTNNVFKSYIIAADMPNGLASTVDGLSIRSVGLNNDEATIGFFSICAVVYSFLYKKLWLTVVGILATFSSVTFIGVVGITCVFIWQFLLRKKTKHKLRNIIIVFAFGFAALIYVNNSNNDIIVGLRTAIELRAESKKDGDHSAEARKLFITKFPACVKQLPTSLMIGTGYNSAVYAYYQEGLEYSRFSKTNPKPTAIENTYIEYFFDLGFFGLLFFLLLYYKIFTDSLRIYNKYKIEFYALIYAYTFGAIFEFAFYHNILYSMDMIVCIAAVLYLNENSKQCTAIKAQN